MVVLIKGWLMVGGGSFCSADGERWCWIKLGKKKKKAVGQNAN